MANVQLRSIGKSYGSVDVIGSIDLSIDDGAFTVFVGPSGCGKSTLLRMIAGLEPSTRGEIEIDGRVINDASPTDRGIAMVFQNYALYPHMTVKENIGFPLKMAGMTKSEIAARVDMAARNLKIDPLLDRKPAALSGGQRQRVAIGRAIVRDPKVFLFDEPLSNLDAELRVQMRLEISKLHRQLGATMIYVTHDQVEAMTLADRIVVLRAGKIVQAGCPVTLYDDPDNVFVAGFIGSPRMNFLNARVKERVADGVIVTLDDFADEPVFVRLSDAGPATGDPVLAGIRPEHFDPNGAVRIEMKVETIENLGGMSFAYGRGTSDELITVDLKGDRSASAGNRVNVAFAPSAIKLFDAASGQRYR